VWRARDRVWRVGEGDVGGGGVRAALELPALLRKLERVGPVCRQAEAALSEQPGARGRVTTRPTPQWDTATYCNASAHHLLEESDLFPV